MPLTVGLAVSAISGGIKLWNGHKQKQAAAKLAAGNKRPVYNIPDEYYNDQSLAQSNAMSGLSADALNYANISNNRGLSAGLDATLQAGGSVNNLAKLYDGFQVNNARTAAEDSQLKTQHLQQLIEANKDLAGQKTQQWALNEYEPYKDTAKLASADKAAGDTNISNGLSSIGSSFANYATAHANDNLVKDPRIGQTVGSYYGQPDLTASPPANVFSATPALSVPTGLYQTPGGQSVLDQMSNGNPNSPYMAALKKALNRPI